MTQSSPREPMPIFVLAGVLGSGKTTLMSRLAKLCIAQDRRVGMVVNDIGELGVDAILLAETGWPQAAVDSLSGECVCCSDSTDLADVLEGMRELRRELILFETTGIADAADMLNQLTAPDLRRLVQTPRLISIVDLTRYPEPLARDPLVKRQIALADAIVLSKADLVDGARATAAIRAIRADNPNVPILQTPDDEQLSALLEVDATHQEALQAALVDGPPGHALPHTVTILLPGKLRRDRFAAVLHRLGPEILRAKGFVALDEQPSLHVFQYVE